MYLWRLLSFGGFVIRLCGAMRTKTTAAWLFVGFAVLMLGVSLFMFDLTEDGKLATFLIVVGLVYFGIRFVGGLVHRWHRDKRIRAVWE